MTDVPVPDSDIVATAKLLIRSYGELAHSEAARRRAEFLLDGDPDGISIWTRICAALDSLSLIGLDLPGRAVH